MTLPVFPCLPRLLSLVAVGSVLLASAYADAPAAGPTPTPANAPALSPPPANDLLEQGVDSLLRASGVPESGNTAMHFAIAAVLLFAALVLRRLATRLLFSVFRRLASRTKTTFDDKLLPALESPVNALFALIGTFAALKVLKLPPGWDEAIRYSAGLAFSLVLLWLILRTLNTALQHAQSIAEERALGVAAFMPWIRKSLVAVAAIFGALVVAQSQGADVQAVLAGLGIGGLAFALASGVSVVMVTTYLRLVVSAKFGFLKAGVAQLVYLVGFSAAHFLEGFTGLTVTVLSIATLFLCMLLTGRVRWSEALATPAPASPPLGPYRQGEAAHATAP